MIRVLQLIETGGPGGAEQVLIGLAQNFNKSPNYSHVGLLKTGWLNDELHKFGIATTLTPLKRSFDPAWFRQILAVIKENNINVIHAHEFSMNCHAAVIGLLTRLPVVCTVHGKNYYPDNWRRRLLYRWVSKTTEMVAVSSDIRDFLAKVVGAKHERLTIIPNGIDIEKFAFNPVHRTEVRTELQLSDAEIVVGAVGNLYPVKGHIHLVEAAALLSTKYPNVKFIIAGRGKEQNRLEELISSEGLSDKVFLLGYRNDAARLLQAMDISVLPSLSEGMPLSLLEAMASKTPVVATRVGGIPETLFDRVNGLLVESRSGSAIAEAISELIECRDLRESLVNNAFASVSKEYSVEAMQTAYESIYQR